MPLESQLRRFFRSGAVQQLPVSACSTAAPRLEIDMGAPLTDWAALRWTVKQVYHRVESRIASYMSRIAYMEQRLGDEYQEIGQG